jgi:hypothetical protein
MFQIPLPILILQHPQEPSRQDKEVSSARLISEMIHPSFTKVGLSWKNLTHALKGWDEIESIPELERPSNWHTLYLGTQKNSERGAETDPGIYYIDRKGDPFEPSEPPTIGGLILLDGTWSQAKTLWWRNAWLNKTQRIFIVPKSKSLYGSIRKEPRPECVSTVEALAETLGFLGMNPEIESTLKRKFSEQLKSFK